MTLLWHVMLWTIIILILCDLYTRFIASMHVDMSCYMYNEIVTVTKYRLSRQREIVCVHLGLECILHNVQSPSPGHSSGADETWFGQNMFCTVPDFASPAFFYPDAWLWSQPYFWIQCYNCRCFELLWYQRRGMLNLSYFQSTSW